MKSQLSVWLMTLPMPQPMLATSKSPPPTPKASPWREPTSLPLCQQPSCPLMSWPKRETAVVTQPSPTLVQIAISNCTVARDPPRTRLSSSPDLVASCSQSPSSLLRPLLTRILPTNLPPSINVRWMPQLLLILLAPSSIQSQSNVLSTPSLLTVPTTLKLQPFANPVEMTLPCLHLPSHTFTTSLHLITVALIAISQLIQPTALTVSILRNPGFTPSPGINSVFSGTKGLAIFTTGEPPTSTSL